MRTARVALLVVSVMAALEPEDVLGDGSVLKTIVRAGAGGKPTAGRRMEGSLARSLARLAKRPSQASGEQDGGAGRFSNPSDGLPTTQVA